MSEILPPTKNYPNIPAINDEIDRAFQRERPVVDNIPWAVLPLKNRCMAVACYSNQDGDTAVLAALTEFRDGKVVFPEDATKINILFYTGKEWDAFMRGIQAGEFDFDTTPAHTSNDESQIPEKDTAVAYQCVDPETRHIITPGDIQRAQAIGRATLSTTSEHTTDA